jgi:diacylglycerol kinase family enzyme
MTQTIDSDERSRTGARWAARLSLVLLLASVVVLVALADLKSLALVAVGACGVVAFVAGVYWFLAHRGIVKWLAAALAVAAPIVVVILYARSGLLWVSCLSIALAVAGGWAGWIALGASVRSASAEPYSVPAAAHPFLVMNPWSGGGKVGKFGLKEKAEALGAEVALLGGPGGNDVEALARDAVARGADLLGVAGGDGTQALVAGIAAEHDLPFLVISAGTRNHFALDLGLDRDDPTTCLDALTDGLETRVDLGVIAGRTFVNNASFGAYAEVVRSPAYRNDKMSTALQMLPDLLTGNSGPKLTARAGNNTIHSPQALLVSNNPYNTSDLIGAGRRAALDTGALGIAAVTVDNARDAVRVLRGRPGRELTVLTADQIVVESGSPEIPVGIDGETIMVPTPVVCTIRPGALKVRLPRHRPGVRPARGGLSIGRLWHLATEPASP